MIRMHGNESYLYILPWPPMGIQGHHTFPDSSGGVEYCLQLMLVHWKQKVISLTAVLTFAMAMMQLTVWFTPISYADTELMKGEAVGKYNIYRRLENILLIISQHVYHSWCPLPLWNSKYLGILERTSFVALVVLAEVVFKWQYKYSRVLYSLRSAKTIFSNSVSFVSD